METSEKELCATFEAAGFELIETHISRVFLRDGDVYKTKRPVNLGFLDFTTLSLRKQACDAEVVLNQRLAPHVYLGVCAVTRADGQGLELISEAALTDQPVLEWAVHMRRLRDEDRADLLLQAGQFELRDIEQIASLLAGFHQLARTDEYVASFGATSVISGNVAENFAQVSSTIASYLDVREREQLESLQSGFVRDHHDLFERRARHGFVRDGHGDLRLEHLYRTSEGYLIIDCIEFNERFRYGDVCSDLSFLAMDLAYHGRSDLSELLIAAYARESRDYELYTLIDFYQGYRAMVRAKVASMLASDLSVSSATREHGRDEARKHYLLALSAGGRSPGVPRLIVSFGLIASGKSKLAKGLSERLASPVLTADRVRKELLGAAPTTAMPEQPFQGAYGSEVTERVYGTMFARAEQILRSGRSVILDASFRAVGHRQAACELAAKLACELVFIECRCPRDLTMQRLRKRAQTPNISDGREEIFDTVAASFEPTTDLSSRSHLLLQTNGTVAQTLAAALRYLDEGEVQPQPALSDERVS